MESVTENAIPRSAGGRLGPRLLLFHAANVKRAASTHQTSRATSPRSHDSVRNELQKNHEGDSKGKHIMGGL